RWYDYLGGDFFLSPMEARTDASRFIIHALTSFLRGEDPLSAEPFIRSTMDSLSVRESVYRYPGSGNVILEVGGQIITVERPTSDLYSQRWVERYVPSHISSDRYIRELIRDVLVGAAYTLAHSGGERIGLEIDPWNGDVMDKVLEKAVSAMNRRMGDILPSHLLKALETTEFHDPFYGDVYDTAMEHWTEMVLEDELRQRIADAVASALPDGSVVLDEDTVEDAVRSYRNDVLADLESLVAMKSVPRGDGVLMKAMSGICAFGLSASGMSQLAGDRVSSICGEMLRLQDLNPLSEGIDLPEDDRFTMVDADGSPVREKLEASITSKGSSVSIVRDASRCVHTVGFGENPVAAYTTVLHVDLQDRLVYTVRTFSSLSEVLSVPTAVCSGSVPVSVSMDIAVNSGWALEGVDYRASETLAEDIADLLPDVLGPLLEPLETIIKMIWEVVSAASSYLVEIGEYVAKELQALYDRMNAPLDMLNRWILEKGAGFLEGKILDMAYRLNLTKQEVSFDWNGFVLTLSTSAVSWVGKTKTLIRAELSGTVSGLDVTAGVTVKSKETKTGTEPVITLDGSVSDGDGGDWSVKVKADPLLKAGKRLVTIDGKAGDVSIDITIPKVEEYNTLGVALSDIPGVGTVLGNIPLPILGVSVGLDAGFEVRYGLPSKKGVLINEFESNPPGTDRGEDWVEILNNDDSTVDLEGYTLTASSDRKNKVMVLSGTLAPGERTVVYVPFVMINTSGKGTNSGESLILKDAEGEEVDKTPSKQDSYNDGRTWQRKYDGATQWVFEESSEDSPNKGTPIGSILDAEALKDITWGSVEKAFDKVGDVTCLEDVSDILRYTVHYTLDGIINRACGTLIDASVYIDVEIHDVSGSASAGFRLALMVDSDLAKDCLKFLAGKLETMIMGCDNPYSKIDLGTVFMEDISLELTVLTGVSMPKVLSKAVDGPSVDAGVTFRANLSSLSRILTDGGYGRPEVDFGIRMIDVPAEAMPSKLVSHKEMHHDLWLMYAEVSWK
ncbi:MAG: lamin tail domain-containing protein, partial [Candidatus Methanomethylophilaceae archaeon]|nr:lamin tail domain-containing protein [Candidatus Methanomethylophilaceae archaeon]